MTPEGRKLAYAAAVLREYRSHCRDNGISLHPAIDALTRYLNSADDRHTPPELDVSDGSNDVLCVTYREAARRLGIGLRTIERHVASGAVRVVGIGGSRRIAVDDLHDFVSRGRMTSGAQAASDDPVGRESA
jgi:excisionase family DNA binding protein